MQDLFYDPLACCFVEADVVNRIELERHEIVATWTIQEYERRKLLTDDPIELAQLDQQIAENQRLLEDVQADLSQVGQ